MTKRSGQKVRVQMLMSLDGYAAGPNQSAEKPFGEDAESLVTWFHGLKAFHELQGLEGGVDSPSNDVVREGFANIGATVMGRNMFGGGPGPDEAWTGWWGENPPFHTPVFVVTHHAREPLVMQGDTTFHFVTDGIESALAQAKAAAGEADVRVGGGADVVNQYLAAGLVDEIELHLVATLLGKGRRLFAGLEQTTPCLELLRSVHGNGVTHLKYRILK